MFILFIHCFVKQFLRMCFIDDMGLASREPAGRLGHGAEASAQIQMQNRKRLQPSGAPIADAGSDADEPDARGDRPAGCTHMSIGSERGEKCDIGDCKRVAFRTAHGVRCMHTNEFASD